MTSPEPCDTCGTPVEARLFMDPIDGLAFDLVEFVPESQPSPHVITGKVLRHNLPRCRSSRQRQETAR